MDNVYKIIITNETGGGNSPTISGAESPAVSTPAVSGTAGKAAGAYVAAQLIKPFISQAITFHTSNVGLVSGSSEAQAKTDLAMSTISGTTALISSAVGGIATAKLIGIGGAAAGPVGAAIGAAVFGVQKLISLNYKQQQIDLNKSVETQELNLARSRYGTSVNRSRGS